MHKLFRKYQDDPEILKFIRSWNRENKKLQVAKQDLRTKDNIETIIDLSSKKVKIHHQMWDYIYEQEEKAKPEKSYKWGIAIGAFVILVGLTNLLYIWHINQ